MGRQRQQKQKRPQRNQSPLRPPSNQSPLRPPRNLHLPKTLIGEVECLCPNKAWLSKVPQRSCSNGAACTTFGGSQTKLRSPHVISPKEKQPHWGHHPPLPLKHRPRAHSFSDVKSVTTAKTVRSLSSKFPHRVNEPCAQSIGP